MISKELLSEVLELTSGNVFIKEIETRNNDIEYLCNVGGWHLLNIYELAHECKKWALSNNFYIYSTVCIAGEGSSYITKDEDINKRLSTFLEDTEPEAIFKACEWIMENKCGS